VTGAGSPGARGLAYPALIALLAVALALAAALSLMIGPAGIGLRPLAGAFGRGEDEAALLILREIRAPRTVLGVLVGATLGLAGASLQGYLRNPLAEPGVVGVSASAALGAVIAIYTGLSAAFPLALPLLAIAGALLSVLVLQGLAGRGAVLTLILAGVAISSLAGALTSLALNLSPNPYAALEIVFWMLGSLTDRSVEHVALAAPFMLTGWLLLALSAGSLDALSLGEETAASLGVNLGRTRTLVVLGAAVSVGAATAVVGVIGFVGLIVPHLLRPLVGHRPSRLLPASALGGAALLMAADILVRLVTPGTELRLGVVTALLGAPFFLHLVIRARAGVEP
jgi:iron complex transport system permease protein